MDGFSLIVGGTLGLLVGWAFSSATLKQREASRKRDKATKAKEELDKKKGEVKNNEDGSFSDTIQGFLLTLLGLLAMFVLGLILFSSLG